MVMLRNLESCTGNDALMSESDVRRTSRTHPIFIGGSDFICSGFGSIQRYDNMFGPSQWNAEDIDDYLGDAARLGRRRRPAHRRRAGGGAPARAGGRGRARRLPRGSAWPTSTTTGSAQAVDAAGSKDVPAADLMTPLSASRLIRDSRTSRCSTWSRALDESGLRRWRPSGCSTMLRARVAGDYLQTVGDLRRGHERAVARHRPERLRRARARATRPTRAAAGARSTPSASSARSTTSAREQAHRAHERLRVSGPAPPARTTRATS